MDQVESDDSSFKMIDTEPDIALAVYMAELPISGDGIVFAAMVEPNLKPFLNEGQRQRLTDLSGERGKRINTEDVGVISAIVIAILRDSILEADQTVSANLSKAADKYIGRYCEVAGLEPSDALASKVDFLEDAKIASECKDYSEYQKRLEELA